MDATAVCTSVHRQEINRHFSNESESDFEPVVENPLDDFLSGMSYRSILFRKYPDLVPVLEQVLSDNDERWGTYKLEKFETCRTKVWEEQNMKTGEMRWRSNSCRGRWCPACGEVKKNLVARNCEKYFSGKPFVRFLTITQKHSGMSLEEQIALAKKNLLKFRRTKEWKKYVKGSVWFMQPKWSDGSLSDGVPGWHVHYHILLIGEYWPHSRVSAKWQKITGDSYIVFIEQVYEKKLRSVIGDIARYAGLPANLLEVPAEHRSEVVHATERSRMCGATGICRKGVALCQPKNKPDDSPWRRMGSWDAIQHYAMAGDKNAEDMFVAGWNEEVFLNARSCQEYDDMLDVDSPGNLSPVEPMPKDLFSKNERAPPGTGVCYSEGDVLDENAPW